MSASTCRAVILLLALSFNAAVQGSQYDPATRRKEGDASDSSTPFSTLQEGGTSTPFGGSYHHFMNQRSLSAVVVPKPKPPPPRKMPPPPRKKPPPPRKMPPPPRRKPPPPRRPPPPPPFTAMYCKYFRIADDSNLYTIFNSTYHTLFNSLFVLPPASRTTSKLAKLVLTELDVNKMYVKVTNVPNVYGAEIVDVSFQLPLRASDATPAGLMALEKWLAIKLHPGNPSLSRMNAYYDNSTAFSPDTRCIRATNLPTPRINFTYVMSSLESNFTIVAAQIDTALRSKFTRAGLSYSQQVTVQERPAGYLNLDNAATIAWIQAIVPAGLGYQIRAELAYSIQASLSQYNFAIDNAVMFFPQPPT